MFSPEMEKVAMLAFHVAISLVAMVISIWCIFGLFSNKLASLAVSLFFATHLLTSLTGFPLAPFGFDPPRAVGIISIVLLLAGAVAYYAKAAEGAWRWTFVICFFAASYLNFFVGAVQAFQKVPSVRALAPTQTELPFVVAQLCLLGLFCVMTIWALRRPGVKSSGVLPSL